ncbi:hypothetical protein SEA_HANNACONDA_197 [Mycobacterium phage Hannaconda]|nr:hypothetical protein SEA_HANNACONDA_197 [Mycobacterium phage Hannaconda]QPO16797.1 hypothetical protein SEA_KASHFLOW_198 [Mycobacterium phage KashFlow]
MDGTVTATGERVSKEDLKGVDVPEGVTAIWGEDWHGNPVIRGLRPGMKLVLRGEFGHGFDVDGPSASLCRECGEIILYTGSGIREVQTHYSQEHGQDLPMLP